MRLSAKKAAENRERVLDTALALFKEHGFDGVSVTDLMRAAGLTHGGFYNHFASKADLEARACGRAFAGSATVLLDAGAVPPGEGRKLGLVGYVSRYLSRTWRDAPAAPCPMVAFGADVSRCDDAVGSVYADGLEAYIAGLAKLADVGGDAPVEARRRAIGLAASLTGALTLARSVRKSNPALSDEILATVREELVRTTLETP